MNSPYPHITNEHYERLQNDLIIADSLPEAAEIRRLLELSYDALWCSKVNCYGFARGVEPDDLPSLMAKNANNSEFATMWGRFSQHDPRVWSHVIPYAVSYKLLTDGFSPVRYANLEREFDKSKGQKIFIAAVNDHFFKGIEFNLWLHKAGTTPVRLRCGTQRVIRDIARATLEYNEDYDSERFLQLPLLPRKSYAGFFVLSKDPSQKYDDHCVAAIFEIFQECVSICGQIRGAPQRKCLEALDEVVYAEVAALELAKYNPKAFQKGLKNYLNFGGRRI